jgi:peptidoglycan/xylan/chitin deacetylase (PgdA/CDA1 family)
MRLKKLGGHLVKKTLLKSGALNLATRAAPTAAVVLMYHSVAEQPELTRNSIGDSHSRATFEAQVIALARCFAPVTIQQVAQFAKGDGRVPARAVAVTFDDGFADNYETALPILNRYGVPATFYIMVNAVATGAPPWYCRLNFAFNTTTKKDWRDPEQGQIYKIRTAMERKAALNIAWEMGARRTGRAQEDLVRQVETSLEVEPLDARSGLMLSWDKVRALKKAGHIIGGHTLSHPNLAHVSAEEARAEIMGCKNVLEEQIGETVDHFSYPHPALNPQWSSQTLEITREAEFKSAVLTAPGPVRRGDDPLGLKRIPPGNNPDHLIWNLQCTFLGRSV